MYLFENQSSETLLHRVAKPLILVLLLAVGLALIGRVADEIDSSPAERSGSTIVSSKEVGGETVGPLKESASPPPAPVPPPAMESVILPAPPRPEIQAEEQPRTGRSTFESARWEVTPEGRFIPSGPILFNTGDAELRETSFVPLRELAEFLRERPQATLEIIGHTDNLGDERVNEKVSRERAEAVADHLASLGVDRGRMQARGMGSQKPIASNETREGRQANRRIELIVAGSH